MQLPALPSTTRDQMDLSVVVDRGDVWYDLPFDDKGRPIANRANGSPHLTLYMTHRGKKIPLVRWRTTIGGWNKRCATTRST